MSPVRVTVYGGSGAWPAAGQACSGYLVELDGFRLLMDPGYAVTPLLDPLAVDAVFVSHGHPDHCADLNPLLRGRVLADSPPVPLPVYALGGVDSPQRVRDCLDEGATGVAVMGAVMRAEDPARFVKELLTI